MIVLTNKHKIPFQIDESDLTKVLMLPWHIHGGYPATTSRTPRGLQRTIFLHGYLLGKAPAGLQWDHHDRDKLNNQRTNLRLVTPRINRRNTSPRIDNRSGVAGVFEDHRGKWWVKIDTTHLGVFDSFEEAVQARLTAEKQLWTER